MNFVTLLMIVLYLNPALSWGSMNNNHKEESNTLNLKDKFSKSFSEKAVWGIREEQIDELFHYSCDLVCLSDPQYLYRVNEAWTTLLGWTEKELLTQPYAQIIHPQDLPSTETVAHQATQSSLIHSPGVPSDISQNLPSKIPMLINFENRFRGNKDEYYNLQWLALLQVSGPKTLPPLLGIAKNITLQKQAENQKQAIERAQMATKLKSNFVTHMSHEIRTPLNGILGFIELALDEPMSDKVRTYLEHAHESALLLLGIANDIVDVSRIEAGALKVENTDFNPAASLESVVNILRLQAQKKNLTLTSFVSSTIPTLLHGDETRLKQILLNLGNNALKFTSQGKVSLKITGNSPPDQPHIFVLQGRVKDTGLGMEPGFIQKLFQPFSQENEPMKRQFGGAGLGLYITKQLCEKMKGNISVLSSPGLGSTFQFHILLEYPRSSVLALPNPKLSLDSIQLPISQVLIVDDNAVNQQLLKELLKRLGCNVDIAEDGLRALIAIRQKSYELVLMDGEMPQMDGLEATRQIRQLFSMTQLPIIGLTAHAMTTHREQFIEAGMNGYLTKPANRKDLIQEILRCCGDHKK